MPEKKGMSSRSASGKQLLLVFPHDLGTIDSGVKARVNALIEYWRSRNYVVDQVAFLECENARDEGNRNPGIRRRYNLPMPRRPGRLQTFIRAIRGKDDAGHKGSALPDYVCRESATAFRDIALREHYDFAVISYLYWDRLREELPAGTKAVAMVEDLLSFNMKFERQAHRYNCLQDEVERLERYDSALFISPDELHLYRGLSGSRNALLVPPILPSYHEGRGSEDCDLVFVGADNPFNREGINWFLEEIFPLLPPSTSLLVAGGVGKTITERRGVTIAGYVDDIGALYAKARLSICPLLGGTGVKIKVLESLACGTPVVGTEWAAVGLLAKNGNGCVFVDEATEMAEAIGTLLGDEDMRARLSAQGREYISSSHSQDTIYKTLDGCFARKDFSVSHEIESARPL
jgi:glycosyltransferase involved in cell wall biosynthesis